MEIFDAGTAIKVEAIFTQAVPFREERSFDPTAPTVTVTDPNGTVKVDGAAMVQSSKGHWYYIVQTVSDWAAGDYTVKTEAGDGVNTGVKQNIKAFNLR